MLRTRAAAKRRASGRARIGPVTVNVVVIVGALLFAFPFYWMVSTALKPESEVLVLPPTWFPGSFVWSNFFHALSEFPFLQGLGNTIAIVVAVEVGRLFSVSISAYAFARLRFPGRRLLFVVVLATMMIPYYVTLIPQYLIFRELGWIDSSLPLTVPSFFGVHAAFFIFLLRQFYLGIPREYDEAAMLDGCGRLRVFLHIILPLSKPALAAVAIFTFLETWNDYLGPLIYLNNPNKFTLALDFQAWAVLPPGVAPHPFSEIMSVATVITLVPVALFFFAQRYFLQGLVFSGVNE